MSLATKTELIELAFTRRITESRIPTDYLEIAQHKYIRPVLTKDLYDDVVANPASYAALLEYIKPVMAWYVRYLMLPELRFEVSDLGTNQLSINNSTPLSDEAFALVRNQALIAAEERVRILNEYLDENQSLYPLYRKVDNVAEDVDIIAGIVTRKRSPFTFYDAEPND